jgi:calcineurin-like phosphoesterase family protein
MALKPPFYVVSDTHFLHRNIIRYAGRPADHEQMMIKRWTRAVGENDTILHLGDLFFGGKEGYEYFLYQIAPRLTGKKYLILGNHDKRKCDYDALGFTVIKSFSMWYRGYEVSFDHYPKLLDEDSHKKVFHVHGHIHSNGYARGEDERWGNINVSVEVMDYRPHRVTRLLNSAIRARNQKRRYTNSRHYRCHKKNRSRRWT